MKQSNNQSSLKNKYELLAQKMANQKGIKPSQLTKQQKTVIFCHFINQQNGLQGISRQGNQVLFPENWIKADQGVYKFNYRYKFKEGSKYGNGTKTVQFRFVSNQQADGSISVNYSVQDSQQLHQYELRFNQEQFNEHFKNYQKHLQQKLKPNNKQQRSEILQPARTLQPQWKAPEYGNNRQPFPLNVPSQSNTNNPFQLPYGKSQYIGPENEIFRGRGGIGSPLNPYGSNPQNIYDPRRPPGARFDPIDPFDSQGVDEKPGVRDFMGFNEFGQPIGKKGGFGGPGFGGPGFNPNKFL